MKKTTSLNMETDNTKLWRQTKQLNDEGNRYDKITFPKYRKMVHGKQAGNILTDSKKQQTSCQAGHKLGVTWINKTNFFTTHFTLSTK